MERAKVLKIMKDEIATMYIEYYKAKIIQDAMKIRSNLRDWSRWEYNGRIYVGWKRINYLPLVNVYARLNFLPLSTIEIIRRKVKAWIEK